MSSFISVLTGLGSALVLSKGVNDLKNPQFNKNLAKAEMIAGGAVLLFTALKISSDLVASSLFHTKNVQILNEDDFQNKYFSNQDCLWIISKHFIGVLGFWASCWGSCTLNCWVFQKLTMGDVI